MTLLPRPLVVTLTALLGGLIFGAQCGVAGDGGGGFTESELYCQAAAAELGACCPDYDPALVACDVLTVGSTRETGSCLGNDAFATVTTTTTTYPTLTRAESVCILGESCGLLANTGVCARAVRAAGSASTTSSQASGCGGSSYSADAGAYDGSTPPRLDAGPVCP